MSASRRLRAAFAAVVLVLGSPLLASGPGEVDEAVAALFAAVRAGNETAAIKAAGLVCGFRDEAVAVLMGAGGGKTPVEIVWTLRCLKEIGSPKGKDLAFELTTHSDAGVRAEAVVTSYMLAGPAAAQVLVRAAGDSDQMVRRRAFDGLVEHAALAEGALDAGLRGIVDDDFWVVLQAFLVLDAQPLPAAGQPDRVVAGIARAVPKLDVRNAAAAFDLMVRRAGPGCGPVVEQALESDRREVVLAALDAAGRIRLLTAVRKVSRLAEDRDPVIGKAAIASLSRINDPASVVFLVDLLESGRGRDRTDAIAMALRHMTGRLFGIDVPKWRNYLAQVQR